MDNTTKPNPDVKLTIPNNQSNTSDTLTPDGTIFVSEQDQFLLVPNTPAFSTASSNKSNKDSDSNEFDESQLGLSLVKMRSNNYKSTPHPLTSELLDGIQYEELTKLKTELRQAKTELSDMTKSHNDQINHFQTMLKKVKAEGEFIGVVKHKRKHRKQQASMKQIQMDYETELEQINSKLKQTQTRHVSELTQIKKAELKYKLEIKLKDQKIKALSAENNELKQSMLILKKTNELDTETLRKEYDDQIEKEINKRIAQVSQVKQQKNAEIKTLNDKNSKSDGSNNQVNQIILNENEKDAKIIELEHDVERLERRYEEEQDMFFKHSEIFDYKLEREGKEKKRLHMKLLQQKVEYETEIKALQNKSNNIKKMLSEQNEINIHLQNNLVILSEQNKTYKEMENDYRLVAENIENDYEEFNTNMEQLKNKNQEKEEELLHLKQFMHQKENENKNLKTNIRSHNDTIIELESVLQGLRDNEEKFEDKKKEIINLNVQINDISINTPRSVRENENPPNTQTQFGFSTSNDSIPNNSTTMRHGYTISYLSNNMDNDIEVKHINELENIKNQYNTLINNMRKEHQRTQKLLKDTEKSKVECLTQFTIAIDQMRTQIRKQCLLFAR